MGVGIPRSHFRPVFIAMMIWWFVAPATAETVSLTTRDGLRIAATIETPATASSEKAPAVIFIHQGGSERSEWTRRQLFRQVQERDMVVLAYDVRGHGESDGTFTRQLFDNPNAAPEDLKAAVRYLIDRHNVDPDRNGIVGSSIGANLALIGVGLPDINARTAVALSGKPSAVYNLAGGRDRLGPLSSVFLIASEREQGRRRARWAREMFDGAAEPKQLEIVEGSRAHGMAVLNEAPDLEARILEWLIAELADSDG